MPGARKPSAGSAIIEHGHLVSDQQHRTAGCGLLSGRVERGSVHYAATEVGSTYIAVDRGVRVVSVIPTRMGDGELLRLRHAGLFEPPSLATFEEAVDLARSGVDAVVLADLWDTDQLDACEACGPQRIERLRRLNVAGGSQPAVTCAECPASP